MKTVTIRDLRLHWPATEESLKLERELLVTRDGRPVARLVTISEQPAKPKRWNPQRHKNWLGKVWKGMPVRLVDKYLDSERRA